jgi:PAS domain S-box-containing protein
MLMPRKATSHHRRRSRARQSPGRRQVTAFSKWPIAPGYISIDSNFAPPDQNPINISKQDQRHLARLVHKFHEFVFEFDPAGQIISMWSSNGELSFEFRRRSIGGHLRTLLGAPVARFLLRATRRLTRRSNSLPLQIPVPTTGKGTGNTHWFELHLYHTKPSAAQFPYFVLTGRDITLPRVLAERLCNTEIMLGHAEETARMGTWQLDLNTSQIRWSKQLFKLHGLDASQFPSNLGEIWRILKFKNIDRLRQDFESAVRAGSSFRFSEPYTFPDGSLRILEGLAAPVADFAGKIVRFVGVTRDVTPQSQANQRWLAHQLLAIRNEEQRRMSRELHETTAQTLAALKMTLGQIGRSVPRRNSKIHKLVQTSATLASDAVREVRLVSSILHPPMLEETGLVTALRSYTKLFAERAGIPVHVEIADEFGRIEKGLELTVFRIVQESLTNVHRHARATFASVGIERDASSVLVEITDDGIGFAQVLPDISAQVPFGVGIAGMRERVDELHGRFDIVSAPGAGTTIRALLPIASQEIPHDDQTNAKRGYRAQTLSDSRRRRSRHRSPRHSRLARN